MQFEELTNLSNSLANLVEQASPGVVQVKGRKRFPASGIVWSTDGVIVTAHHVLESDENIQVKLQGMDLIPATLIGRDPTTDIAVIRITKTGSVPLLQASLTTIKVGQVVLALGRPAQNIMATWGIVSLLEASWRTHGGGILDAYLQASVQMLPGFSGGPLINSSGLLVGMNTSALLRDSNLTIPTETLSRVIEMLLTHGRVRQGFLGVGTQPVRLPTGMVNQYGQKTGLLIISLEADSPASRAGLFIGDILIQLDNQLIRHVDDFLASLSADRIGKTIQIKVIRGGQPIELEAILGERM